MPQAPMLSGSGWCQGSSEVSSEGADAEGLFSGSVGVGMTETERSQLAGFEPELPSETHLDGKPGQPAGKEAGIAGDAYSGSSGNRYLDSGIGGKVKEQTKLRELSGVNGA